MPITDYFDTRSSEVTGPLNYAETITPSDTNDLTRVTRAIWVGTEGDLQVTLRSGETVTFANMYPGWHPIRATRVWATGTTASALIGCC